MLSMVPLSTVQNNKELRDAFNNDILHEDPNENKF